MQQTERQTNSQRTEKLVVEADDNDHEMWITSGRLSKLNLWLKTTDSDVVHIAKWTVFTGQ